MKITMGYAGVAVKGRKSATFAAQMLAPRRLVNHC